MNKSKENTKDIEEIGDRIFKLTNLFNKEQRKEHNLPLDPHEFKADIIAFLHGKHSHFSSKKFVGGSGKGKGKGKTKRGRSTGAPGPSASKKSKKKSHTSTPPSRDSNTSSSEEDEDVCTWEAYVFSLIILISMLYGSGYVFCAMASSANNPQQCTYVAEAALNQTKQEFANALKIANVGVRDAKMAEPSMNLLRNLLSSLWEALKPGFEWFGVDQAVQRATGVPGRTFSTGVLSRLIRRMCHIMGPRPVRTILWSPFVGLRWCMSSIWWYTGGKIGKWWRGRKYSPKEQDLIDTIRDALVNGKKPNKKQQEAFEALLDKMKAPSSGSPFPS